ncbi:MAG: ferredoxin--NADP reductase [bacterium]|nr:ferredoxin--NADP reductase [bacterium]MDE0289184.1 ferredoxin--NADP reductase [bacterium]MDE0438283.1 ferredoxin--NADP reductase [bacterium]
MRGEFHRLRVLGKRAETRDATSVSFEVPPPLREAFRWRAGQHITLRFRIEGRQERRPYSISQNPFGDRPLRVTVKRIRGGLVSNHIHRNVVPGQAVDVMPPFGGFCLDADPRERRTHYFFGAGSGITPLYAMIGSVLAAEPYSTALLAYGNTDYAGIIFRDALGALESGSGGRLRVRHVLSSPTRRAPSRPWRRGRIGAATVADFIDEHPPYAQDTRYYVCGPGDMNTVVRAALLGIDVPEERIHTESYRPTTPPDDSVAGVGAAMTVHLDGRTLQVTAEAGQTILEAVRDAGAAPPYSCESGVCGACRARLRDGSAHLRATMALTSAELARGVILTCQALPTTPRLTVDYG